MNSLSDFFASKPVRDYPKGQILLYQAEQTDSVFYIKSGFVKVYDINSNGDEKLLMVLGAGDIYPVVWTFRVSEKLLYFYETMSDAEITVVNRREFTEEVNKSHNFTKALLKHFVERIKELTLRVECLEASNAKFKIAQVLDYLLQRHPADKFGKMQKLALVTTHQIIASMAGTSRETASTVIKELEDKGILSQAEDTLAINRAKLSRLLEDE